jgi:hypothetical protein
LSFIACDATRNRQGVKLAFSSRQNVLSRRDISSTLWLDDGGITVSAMFNLTRQQQLFLCGVLLLLLVGWAVKAWRTAHPPARTAVSITQ